MKPCLGLLSLVLALLPISAHAQDALLLGFRVHERGRTALPGAVGKDSLRRSGYRTLLIYANANGQYRGQSGAGLLLRTGGGLMRVGTKRSVYNRWGEDFVWAARPGEVPEYSGISAFNGEYCEGYRTQEILFAGGRYVAVETHTAGFCDGSASPWDFNTLAVLPLDTLTVDGVDIAAVLGADGDVALRDGAEVYLNRLSGARRDEYIPEPDPANWALVRKRGRWAVVGRLEPIEMVSTRRPADFEVPLAIPPALTGPQGSVRWEQVIQAARDADDAFASPTAKLIAIQRPNLLTIHPVQGGRIGQAILGQPLESGAEPVVIQWIDARTAEAARRVLRSANHP